MDERVHRRWGFCCCYVLCIDDYDSESEVLWPRSDKKAFYLRTDKSRSKSEALDKAFPNRRKKRKPFKSKRLSRSQSPSLTSCKPKATPHPQQQKN